MEKGEGQEARAVALGGAGGLSTWLCLIHKTQSLKSCSAV